MFANGMLASPKRCQGIIAKLSMPGALQRIYCNVEGQQSIEQGRLAVKMMLAEPIAWHLFAAMFEESEPEQGRGRILASIA